MLFWPKPMQPATSLKDFPFFFFQPSTSPKTPSIETTKDVEVMSCFSEQLLDITSSESLVQLASFICDRAHVYTTRISNNASVCVCHIPLRTNQQSRWSSPANKVIGCFHIILAINTINLLSGSGINATVFAPQG